MLYSFLYKKLLKSRKIYNLILFVFLFSIFSCISAFAKNSDTAFLRVKICFETESGKASPVTEEDLTIQKDWTKNGDYWYYNYPVEEGDSIEFLQSVQIPHSCTSDMAKETFKIVLYAEAAENVRGVAAWDGKIDDFSGKFSKAVKLDLSLKEYELDADGNLIPYVNNKVVLPGDKIEKHVFLDIDFSYKSSSSSGGSGGSSKPKEPKRIEIVYPLVPDKSADAEEAAPPLPFLSVLAETGDRSNVKALGLISVLALIGFILITLKKKK